MVVPATCDPVRIKAGQVFELGVVVVSGHTLLVQVVSSCEAVWENLLLVNVPHTLSIALF